MNFRLIRTLLATSGSVTLALATATGARADVILHAFNWPYAKVAAEAEQIARAGYKAVLLSPPLKTDKTGSCRWWQRYQPQDLRVIDNCDGNRESLKAAIDALRAHGVRAYADVVVNQMANERGGATVFPGDAALLDYTRNAAYWRRQILYGDADNNGTLDNGFLPDRNKPAGLFSSQDFHPAACIGDYTNKEAVIKGRICGDYPDTGLPDLKDTEPGQNWVNQQRQQYVQALHKLGVRGFRIDAAKHMPLDAIKSMVPESVRKDSHIFAEIITGGGTTDRQYQLFLEPYLRSTPASFGAYDFPLLNALHRAFLPGNRLADVANPYATGNALANDRAVTVVVTHDIPYNKDFRTLIFNAEPGKTGDEELAYAYILGRDGGTPLVFDDRSKEQTDNGRWRDAWNNTTLLAMIRFHNQMQGKPMQVLAADDCTLLWRRQEDGIVAINKCAEPRAIEVDTRFRFKWNHPYRDAITGSALPRIEGPRYTFQLPARSARMWIAE